MNQTHRSDEDFTSSRFQSPHVRCLAVDKNNKMLTQRRIQIGPKKQVRISTSPGKRIQKDLFNETEQKKNYQLQQIKLKGF